VYPSDMAAPILAASNNKFPTNLIPLERVGTVEEMAGATLFLTSMAGGYCNGNILISDGGRLSMMPSSY
jgi:NAD(P)-dependent dehydrogenase (short-subunit alcohol dehydrogenase family)